MENLFLYIFSFTPEENVFHLSWIVKLNICHGLSFEILLFTNQEKSLCAVIAFTNENDLLDESYRSAIKFNVKVFTIHFFWLVNYLCPKQKEDGQLLFQYIQRLNRAHISMESMRNLLHLFFVYCFTGGVYHYS